MPRQEHRLRVALPRDGRVLSESTLLTRHAVERFILRGGRPEHDRDPQAALHALVATRGIAVPRPPTWFQNTSAAAFFIVIDGRYALPVIRNRRHDQVLPARPWKATTFISRALSDRELELVDGESLAALTYFPARVVTEWFSTSATATHPSANALATALASVPAGHGHFTIASHPDAGEEIRVRFHDGVLALIRARPSEAHAARYRAIAWRRSR